MCTKQNTGVNKQVPALTVYLYHVQILYGTVGIIIKYTIAIVIEVVGPANHQYNRTECGLPFGAATCTLASASANIAGMLNGNPLSEQLSSHRLGTVRGQLVVPGEFKFPRYALVRRH